MGFGVQYKVEHNKTSEGESEVVEDSIEGPTVYGRGMLDLCNLFAQACLWIIIQAIIQEFFLEKLVKKFHLSKRSILDLLKLFKCSHGLYLLFCIELKFSSLITDIYLNCQIFGKVIQKTPWTGNQKPS